MLFLPFQTGTGNQPTKPKSCCALQLLAELPSKRHYRTSFPKPRATNSRQTEERQAWAMSRLFSSVRKAVSCAAGGRRCVVTAGEARSKEPECVQLLALEDGVRNWPWPRAACCQRFARRNPPRFWELFISTHLMGGACEGLVLCFTISSRTLG